MQPNFFVVGAPRCGTTSLTAWLRKHPHIYMSPIKEPFYYSPDVHRPAVSSKGEYEELFKNATSAHAAIGEASTSYLFSELAVPSIEKELPRSKYIALVRNPIEMALSLHQLCITIGDEHVTDFQIAWRLSPARRDGKQIRRGVHNARQLDYQQVCKLGDQIGRLYETVPPERALVIVLDDMRADPQHEYLRVLRFLDLSDDGRSIFPVQNAGRAPRWPRLHSLLMRMLRGYRSIERSLGIPSPRETGLVNRVATRVVQARPRGFADTFTSEIVKYYEEDVEKLGQLIGRDLSHWLEINPSRQRKREL